jgi:hypothetical protein
MKLGTPGQGVLPVAPHLDGVLETPPGHIIGLVPDLLFGRLARVIRIGADVLAGDRLNAGKQPSQKGQSIFDSNRHRGASIYMVITPLPTKHKLAGASWEHPFPDKEQILPGALFIWFSLFLSRIKHIPKT